MNHDFVTVLVCGGRDYKNKDKVWKELDGIQRKYLIGEIVIGLCPTGADSFAKEYAEYNEIPIVGFPAQWNIHGRAAGPIRNEQMAEYVSNKEHSVCFAFWDGVSKGTKSMINLAKKYGIDTIVFKEKEIERDF